MSTRWYTLSSTTRVAVGLYLVMLALYLVTASGHFYSTDHVQVYATAESLVERGTLEMAQGVGARPEDGAETFAIPEPLQSIASTPLYIVGDLVDAYAPDSMRASFAGDDLGPWGGTVQIFFVSLFNQLLTPALVVLFFYFCMMLGFSIRTAFWTAAIYGVSTMAFVGAHEYFQHPLETILLLGCLYVLVSNRTALTRPHVFWASTLLALGVLTRLNVLAAVPVVLAYIVFLRMRSREGGDTPLAEGRSWVASAASRVRGYLAHWRSEWPYYAMFLAPFVVTAGIFLYLDSIGSGHLPAVREGSVGEFSLRNVPAALYGYLLSPGRAFFLYSPPAIAGVFMYRRYFRAHAAEAVLFAGIALVYLAVYCSFQFWHGAGCWGPRYLETLVPLSMVPVAYVIEDGRHLRLLVVLALLGALIALLGTVVNPVYAEEWRGYWGNGVNQPLLDNAYFYVPSISPPVVHFQDFFAGRNWDLWLQFVLHDRGALPFLAGLAAPVLAFLGGLKLLSQGGMLDLHAPAWVEGLLEEDQPERVGADE